MPGARRSTTTQARPCAAPASLASQLVEEACNRGNLTILDELLPPAGGADDATPLGRLREYLAAFRIAVPDARWTIIEQIATPEALVLRLQVQGTFSGPLLGLAPPGRPATLTGVAIGHLAAGRLVALWLQADLLDLLQQLEVLPPLALTQALTMARVLHAGTLLAAAPGREPSRAPPRPKTRR